MKNSYISILVTCILALLLALSFKPLGKVVLAKMDQEDAWEEEREIRYQDPVPVSADGSRIYCDSKGYCIKVRS
jgi:hypothetical protein